MALWRLSVRTLFVYFTKGKQTDREGTNTEGVIETIWKWQVNIWDISTELVKSRQLNRMLYVSYVVRCFRQPPSTAYIQLYWGTWPTSV